MNTKNLFEPPVVIAALFFCILYPAFAQIGPELQMAELSKKLQLTDTQKKQLAPIVEQRDREAKALKADTSMGKLQKLRQGRHQTKTLGLPRRCAYSAPSAWTQKE